MLRQTSPPPLMNYATASEITPRIMNADDDEQTK
jgi:hypothetical protein